MEVLFCPILFLTFSNCGRVHISEAGISVKTLEMLGSNECSNCLVTYISALMLHVWLIILKYVIMA